MSYKMIAIGILALLALSSVMNPKAFRFLSGILAVTIVTLVTGYFVLASYPSMPTDANASVVTRQLNKLRALFHEPTGNEAARQRVLDGFKEDLIDTDQLDAMLNQNKPQPNRPQPKIVVIERHSVDDNVLSEQQVATAIERILLVVGEYLKGFKKINQSAEVARVQASDLNLTLLGFQAKRGKDGKIEGYTVVFDEAFNRHVLVRARQLEIKERLITTTYACVGTGVVMFLMFGVLKVLNSRKRVRPESDLLRLSGVSMI